MDPKELTDSSGTGDPKHLVVPPQGNPRESFALSIASSTRTYVDDNDEIVDIPATVARQNTEVAGIRLTLWDCLKAIVFGPGSLRTRLTASIERSNPEVTNEKLFTGKRKCPFVQMISVFPCEASHSRIPLEGRCVLDTACFQGNIISSEFAHALGFTEFEPLSSKEQDGGIVANGSKHDVSGALYLSWFHSTSVKVYRDMRFLVSESAPVDLVIGTHSIVRHRLISPPNLMAGNPYIPPSNDQHREYLRAIESGDWNRKREAETRLSEAKEHGAPDTTIRTIEQDIATAKENYRLDHSRRHLYDALVYRDHLPPDPEYPHDLEPGEILIRTEIQNACPRTDVAVITGALDELIEQDFKVVKEQALVEEIAEMIAHNHASKWPRRTPRVRRESLSHFLLKVPAHFRPHMNPKDFF